MPSILLVISTTKFWRMMLFLQWCLVTVAIGLVVYPKMGWLLYAGVVVSLLSAGVLWWQLKAFERSTPTHIILQETHVTLLPSAEQNEVWFVSKGSIVWAWLVMLVLENDLGQRRYVLLQHTQLPVDQWSALLRGLKMGWGRGCLGAQEETNSSLR